jgi:hypothetical protein
MKHTFLAVVVLTLVFAVPSFAQATAADQETSGALEALTNYVNAHATGDPAFARKAFHTEGNMLWIAADGKYMSETFDAFIKRAFTGKPAADEDKRKAGRKIESVEVSGNAGRGKIILDYPNVRFVDYMTLLKINGEWKIVSKVFYAERKAAPVVDAAKPTP